MSHAFSSIFAMYICISLRARAHTHTLTPPPLSLSSSLLSRSLSYVSMWGRRVGVPTPFCDKIVEIVHTLGVGFAPSPDHVAPLVDMVTAVEATCLHAASTTTATATATQQQSNDGADSSTAVEDDLSSSPLSVAAVGCGYFARFHLEAWSRMDGVTLAAVCDRDLSKAKTAAEVRVLIMSCVVFSRLTSSTSSCCRYSIARPTDSVV